MLIPPCHLVLLVVSFLFQQQREGGERLELEEKKRRRKEIDFRAGGGIVSNDSYLLSIATISYSVLTATIAPCRPLR